MEKFEQNGYEFLRFLNKSKLHTGNLNNPNVTSAKESIEGRPSIINRYALFTYKGGDSISTKQYHQPRIDQPIDVQEQSTRAISAELYDALSAAYSVQKEDNIVDNPKATQIVNFFKENPKNAVEYELIDFLYCKWYGLISNNYMVTLRRFPFAVEDNIFNKAFCPNPDLARCVTYWGKGTGNDLNSILGFSTGFNWKELVSEVQTLNSMAWGSPYSGLTGAAINTTNRTANLDETIKKDNNRAINNGSDTGHLDEQGEGYYHNKILGPVNVIHKMNIRDRGLKYDHNIKLIAEYEMKSYGDIKPKEAMLEILTNLLTIGTNNAPFWGGSIRYRPDNRTSYLIGDRDALMKGDYYKYLNSAREEMTTKLGNIFTGKNGESNFSSILGGLFDAGKSLLSGFISDKLTSSGAVPQYQVVNALLTGEATGEWHMTIGNPLRPIAVMGNLILDNMTITFDETLGSEDFPIGIKAEFDLKPARPRDKQDIENMFNLGQGRLWYKPENREDVIKNANASVDSKHIVIDKSKGKDETQRQYSSHYEDGTKNNLSIMKQRFGEWDDTAIGNSLKFHSVNENYFGNKEQGK